MWEVIITKGLLIGMLIHSCHDSVLHIDSDLILLTGNECLPFEGVLSLYLFHAACFHLIISCTDDWNTEFCVSSLNKVMV